MAETAFTGDRKEPLVSPTAALEKRLVGWLTPRVPLAIGSHHLTLMTVAWSALTVFAAWMAGRGNLGWLWLSSLMLVLQWFTDSLDGSVGRWREQGLRRWGFFMDHFLDYVFMACICGQYAFVTAGATRVLFLLMVPLYAAIEVVSWLDYGATGKFRITYNGFGPTEVRLFFIGINTAIILWGAAWLTPVLPPFMIVLGLMLLASVYQTQRRIWAMDMEEKAGRGNWD